MAAERGEREREGMRGFAGGASEGARDGHVSGPGSSPQVTGPKPK